MCTHTELGKYTFLYIIWALNTLLHIIWAKYWIVWRIIHSFSARWVHFSVKSFSSTGGGWEWDKGEHYSLHSLKPFRCSDKSWSELIQNIFFPVQSISLFSFWNQVEMYIGRPKGPIRDRSSWKKWMYCMLSLRVVTDLMAHNQGCVAL